MVTWVRDIERMMPSDRVSTRHADREAASRDESTLPGTLPDVVVWPLTTGEVAQLIRFAYESVIPVTARGAGSSLEGNPIPVLAGMVIDCSRMNRVLRIDTDDLLVHVEPGVVYSQLNDALRSSGLFFPPHPGGSADVATIGGMVANNASGIYAVKYGGTRDYVRAATVVTGTGEILRLGSTCPKTSSGYHLIGLLVGSEGTLAIATEIAVALAPLPPARERAAFCFPNEGRAAVAIAAMMRFGVDLAAVEYLDGRCANALNRFLGIALPEQPLILIEVHGSPHVIHEQLDAAQALCAEQGAAALGGAADPWASRHHITRAIQAQRPDAQIVRTDLAFPVSQLPAVVAGCYDLAAGRRVVVHTFGHAGLGILHALILAERADTAAWQNATALKNDLVTMVIGMGGSVSGEHGLGIGNRQYAALEHGDTLALMRGIKRLFDPKGILNPGKLWE